MVNVGCEAAAESATGGDGPHRLVRCLCGSVVQKSVQSDRAVSTTTDTRWLAGSMRENPHSRNPQPYPLPRPMLSYCRRLAVLLHPVRLSLSLLMTTSLSSSSTDREELVRRPEECEVRRRRSPRPSTFTIMCPNAISAAAAASRVRTVIGTSASPRQLPDPG